jgi:hypothetical protein
MNYFLSIVLFAFSAHSASQAPFRHPLKTCESCVPAEEITAPGIGFDLTTSYG